MPVDLSNFYEKLVFGLVYNRLYTSAAGADLTGAAGRQTVEWLADRALQKVAWGRATILGHEYWRFYEI